MDNLVFLAVVFSAIFQASWNFFAKKSSAHKSALLYIGWFGLGLVGVPLASIFTDFSQFSPLSVYYILLSGFIHFLYVYLLGRAYTLGDISVVYPISRGLGIVLTTVFSHFLALDSISIFGFFGIGLVVSGCFLVASKELKSKSGSEGFWAAALVALAVSAYSIACLLYTSPSPRDNR